jgi:hypothetical protein
VRSDPQLTLSTLNGWLYPPFLLQACTAVGIVGLRWSDCGRALQILGWARFLQQTCIADLLPLGRRGVLLLEPRYGRNMATTRVLPLEGDYYRSQRISITSVYLLPYFRHPSLYVRGKLEIHRDLVSVASQRTNLMFFAGSKGAYLSESGQRIWNS